MRYAITSELVHLTNGPTVRVKCAHSILTYHWDFDIAHNILENHRLAVDEFLHHQQWGSVHMYEAGMIGKNHYAWVEVPERVTNRTLRDAYSKPHTATHVTMNACESGCEPQLG